MLFQHGYSINNELRSDPMSTIGFGYGSEWQMLRFLGRHRRFWNETVAGLLTEDGVGGITCIEWLDFPFSAKTPTHDQELKGMDFLDKKGWVTWKQSYWPDPAAPLVNRDGIHTWDAVGRLYSPANPDGEWLLAEAKAHESELFESPACGAGGSSLVTITAALKQTFLAMGCAEADWERRRDAWLTVGNYQIANRLAALHFLRHVVHQPARLLFVYLLNDRFEGRQCPATAQPWNRHLVRMYDSMGILFEHKFKPFIHYLCLDVTNGQRCPLIVKEPEPAP
jgi:hypothetical protein